MIREKLNEAGQITTLYVDESDYIKKPLWYHLRGLMQTSTGYGRKLTTDRMVKYNNRLHRIYVSQHSNSGTAYILVKGNWIFIN